jgi:hypothetical protein
MIRYLGLLAALAVVGTTDAAEEAVKDDLRPKIERLLTLASEPSAKNLRAVEDYYQSLPAADRQNRQVSYAYAVALIRQRRLHGAQPT